ncbi:MAG: hypothetical protein CSB55_03005 [Candidatus Cloacimonadota bacterium]|nr:MAG: hypothetical protein CSB55_03005 [Candidatus Cloacimonadota bacterium]
MNFLKKRIPVWAEILNFIQFIALRYIFPQTELYFSVLSILIFLLIFRRHAFNQIKPIMRLSPFFIVYFLFGTFNNIDFYAQLSFFISVIFLIINWIILQKTTSSGQIKNDPVLRKIIPEKIFDFFLNTMSQTEYIINLPRKNLIDFLKNLESGLQNSHSRKIAINNKPEFEISGKILFIFILSEISFFSVSVLK